MNNDEFWSSVHSNSGDRRGPARLSALRLALLFGTAAIALALIVPPMIAIPGGGIGQPDIDFTTTASVPTKREYTIHRSVLQPPGGAVCIIDSHGGRTGDCE